MANFNRTKSKKLNTTTNYMGEPAYNLDDEAKLLGLVSTCMINEPKYYGDIGKTEQEIFDLCNKIRSEYILKVANYARNELYLRSVPIYLLAIASHINDTKKYVRKYAPLIIKRADELNEILACYIELFGKPIPMCLKKGIADAFSNFDEYQFGKYNRSAKDVTFRHTILLTHPAFYNKRCVGVVKQILDDKISTPVTWETELSAKGNKAEVWDSLISNRKLPYMATIRNLRNIATAGATKVEDVVRYIENDKAIQNSKQLPIRFLSAYEALSEGVSEHKPRKSIKFENETPTVETIELFRKALNTAITKSADMNIPKIHGKTIIICDNSGSARGDYGGASKISLKSVRKMSDAGNLMGLLAWYSSDNTFFGVFGDKLIEVKPDRSLGILENFKRVDEAGEKVGQATEQGVFTCLETMIREKTFADRIIVCSDLQIGDGKNKEYGLSSRLSQTVPELVKEYRRKVNPNFMYYSMCFNNYGTDVIIGDKKVLITGWSDNILKFIQTTEKNSTAQINHIKTNFGINQPTQSQQEDE